LNKKAYHVSHNSPSFVSTIIYFPEGNTKQFVCPYIASGRKVPATKNNGLSPPKISSNL